MKKGFSLLEVMITLLVIMLIFLASARISVLNTRSSRYSEDLTHASVLGHTRLVKLKRLPLDSPDLETRWHKDDDNPLEYGQGRFYQFWQVDEAPEGRKVVLHVAWDESTRPEAKDFGSLAALEESGCPHISFHDVMP